MKRIVGKIVDQVIVNGEDEIIFKFKDGSSCKWLHYQNCCEGVWIEDVNGDWDDLVGTELLVAEERTEDDYKAECGMWTFYTFRSIKGSVDVRWYGSSNGYYSVSVDFEFSDDGSFRNCWN